MESVEKVWGRELIVTNGAYCGKRMTLFSGKRCSFHYHAVKDETFYVEEGAMLLEMEKEPKPDRQPNEIGELEVRVVRRGGDVHIRPHTVHRFTGLSETTIFYEFSTHDEPSDSIRLTQSEAVPDEEMRKIREGRYAELKR